jgi:FG-GAP repeat
MGEILMRLGRSGAWCLMLALGLAAAAPACNWTTFADDANKAPVRSISPPDSFKSKDFGASLFPLSDGQGKAAAFVATSINDRHMVVMSVESGGGISTATVPATALTDTDESEITSVVEATDTAPVRLLLATPKLTNGSGRIYSYLLSPALDGSATTLSIPSLPLLESGLGRGLAVGHLAGIEGKPDIVIASDDKLVVWVDEAMTGVTANVTGTGCDVAFDVTQEPRYLVRRPLLTARLWNDPPGAMVQQVVSGSTFSGAPGKVSFFSVTTDGTTFSLNCLAAATAPPPKMSRRFGKSLVTGDFDNNNVADLLVGAPGQEAFVYLNIGSLPTGTLPAPIPISDSSGVDFGFGVAALNIDDQAGDEALIADPGATVDGHDHAGRVVAYAFDSATMTMKLSRVYADHHPETNANFGSTVNALKFCTATSSSGCPEASTSRVLLIGASNEVFLYYREGELKRNGSRIDDVRGP